MKNITKTLLLLVIIASFYACEDPVLQDPAFSVDSMEEFTVDLQAEIIEANFSRTYGGLKYEQDVFYNAALEDIDECDFAEKFTFAHSDESGFFDIDIKWDYNKQCGEAVMVYNDRFHNVHNDGSTLVTNSDHFKLDITPGSSQSISGNFEDNRYQYYQSSLRSFSFLEGTGGDETFSGSILFTGGSCLFDFDSGTTIDQEIGFRLRMNSTSIEAKRIEEEGVIRQVETGWELEFDNGAIYEF